MRNGGRIQFLECFRIYNTGSESKVGAGIAGVRENRGGGGGGGGNEGHTNRFRETPLTRDVQDVTCAQSYELPDLLTLFG